MIDAAPRPAAGDAAVPSRLTVELSVVLLVTGFYLVTAPANHSLAIDPYFYAGYITRSPMGVVPHPREMLWILSMQGAWRAVGAVVADPDPFLIARVVNSLLTALALLVFARIVERDLGQPRAAAWLSAGLFGASYAVWRYATEIEVYAPAVLLSLLVAHAAFGIDRPGAGRPDARVAALAAMGAASTLVYQPLGFLPAVAVPAYLALRGQWRRLPLYFLVSGTLVLAGYGAAVLVTLQGQAGSATDYVFHTSELRPSRPGLDSLLAVVFAVGSDLLSSHWIFAHAPLRDAAAAASVNGIEEEVYAATRAGWVVWVPVATLPLAAGLLAALVPAALRAGGPRAPRERLAALALWLALHAAMMIVLVPGGFEGWILGLVPLSLLMAALVVGPAVAAGRAPWVAALLGVVLVHNALAGLGVVRSEAGDYLRPRGEAALARTGPGDLILVPDKWGLEHYLRLMGRADVLRVDEPGRAAARAAVAATLAAGGRVVVLDDVRGVLDDAALAAAERFDTGDAGGAWELRPAGAAP